MEISQELIDAIQTQAYNDTGIVVPGDAIRQILHTISQNQEALEFLGKR